ncbi:hypothetical protein XFF6991_500007 [Xanthomonas phaseoli pv. phaseoli]|uniref:Uncharacterized protein n=2 Tax=Xanthomonas TaxID=338 RepID=A0A7Z7NIB7_XANCH|nr:hypothetical protein XFF6991_500007 [Xanthomonas phaseoli pv. phaseoli]
MPASHARPRAAGLAQEPPSAGYARVSLLISGRGTQAAARHNRAEHCQPWGSVKVTAPANRSVATSGTGSAHRRRGRSSPLHPLKTLPNAGPQPRRLPLTGATA